MTSSKEHLQHCYNCPNLCRHACPVADADQNEMSTPQAKMATMKLLSSKKMSWSKEAAMQAYKCSNCGDSTESCELNNPVASILDQFRILAFKKGMTPQSVYRYCEDFKYRNNPYKVRLQEKLQKHLPSKSFEPSGVTYFPGCTEIHHNVEAIGHTLQLFDKLKIGPTSVFDGAIQCCGYPLLMAGDVQGFKEHAEVMMHMLEEYPVIVSGAPACLFTLQQLYPAHGFPLKPRFVSVVEFLDSCISQKNFHVRKGVPTRVAYHDPCYLGRYMGVYESPRRILTTVSGEVPREFRRCREHSHCSGGGGLLPVSCPETAKKMAINRLNEFKETGASVLVTACPTCEHRFRKYGQRVQVKNMVEFLNNAIEPEEGVHGEAF